MLLVQLNHFKVQKNMIFTAAHNLHLALYTLKGRMFVFGRTAQLTDDSTKSFSESNYWSQFRYDNKPSVETQLIRQVWLSQSKSGLGHGTARFANLTDHLLNSQSRLADSLFPLHFIAEPSNHEPHIARNNSFSQHITNMTSNI